MRSAASTAPLISVALCTFNGAAYLRGQLESLIAQTGVLLEIVAVDDASTDQSFAILEEYAASDARIRCFRNARTLGPTANFEQAMAACRGAFIAPCDQDDLWHPGKLEQLLAAMASHDLAYCDSAYVDANGNALQRRISDAGHMFSGITATPFFFANSVSGHAMLLRRELFERARPFPPAVYYDWWLALCAAGRNGVGYIPQSLVQFRRHPNAYSPIGRAVRSRKREAARSWLEERHALLRAYAAVQLRGSDTALAFAEALRFAIDQGRYRRLFGLLWSERHALPRETGIAMIDAIGWQLRLLRKLQRARRAAKEQR